MRLIVSLRNATNYSITVLNLQSKKYIANSLSHIATHTYYASTLCIFQFTLSSSPNQVLTYILICHTISSFA